MFWMTTITPLIICLVLIFIISVYDNLTFAIWNAENIGIAYTHFKVPLIIASLSFPLGAVVIASHRSAQTLMMADLQSSQNRFANYFLHLDRFKDELLEKPFSGMFVSYKTTHDKLFPNLFSTGSLDLNTKIITCFAQGLVDIDKKAKQALDTLDTEVSDIRSNPPHEPIEVHFFIDSPESRETISEITNKCIKLVNKTACALGSKNAVGNNLNSVARELDMLRLALKSVEIFTGIISTNFDTHFLDQVVKVDAEGYSD